MRIVGIIKPFVLNQQFTVYDDDNNLIIAFESSFEEFDKNINEYIKKYNIDSVDLIGPHQFTRGLIKNTKERQPNVKFTLL